MVNALFFTLLTLIWGTTWYAIEFQLGVVPQAWSVSYRFSLAALILFVLAVALRQPLRYPALHHRLFAATGAAIFCFNYLLVYYGTAYLTSGLVAVAFSALSLFNLMNGRLLLKQPLAPAMLLGAVCGTAGLVLVFWPEVRQLSLADDGLLGLLLVIGAAFTASLGSTFLASERARRVPKLPLNAWSMAYGGLIMAGVALISQGAPVLDTRPSYVWSLAYLVLWGTVLSFTLLLMLIDRIGLGPSGYVAVMTPLVALIISTVFEGYEWTPLAILGIALVLCGNVLIRLRRGSKVQLIKRSV
ncbi:MAG: DMT family transporter [Rhodothalassiaceae bacterium]